MAQKVMRMSRNGGMSLCASPEEKVGKGRCHHILNSNDVAVNFNKNDNCYYASISDKNLESVKIKDNEKDIKEYINKLSLEIDKDKKDKILKILKK